MVFCITIMLLGVIGNIMVPIVILKTKDMRNSTNIFLTNLSIADLLVLLVCTPTVLVEVNTKPETWVLGHEMCKAVPFVELTVAHASVLTILAISFERYYAICEPLKAGYVCTKTRALMICLAAWAVAAIFTSPILLMADYRYEEYYDGSWVPVCLTQASNVWNITFFVMTISAFFILPLFILIVLYTIIAKNLIAKDGRMVKIRPSKPELSFKARKQVVLMLGAVVLSFFLCLIPFRIFTLWIIIVPDEMVKKFGLENYYNCLYFSRIMLYLNSAINPILYNLMSSKFRKGFRKLCCGKLWFDVERCQRFERGAAPVQYTNTTNTTTTTSIASQNMCKRLSHSRTISQEDGKHGSITSSHPSETWQRRCSGSIDSADNFRRIVLKNTRYKRQRSSQSMTTSGDEENVDIELALCTTCAKFTGPRHKAQITFSTSCDSNGSDADKKNGVAGPKYHHHHHPRKKKLKFQHCFDEDKTIQLNDVTADAVDAKMLSETNRKAEQAKDDEVEHDQHIVPFLS